MLSGFLDGLTISNLAIALMAIGPLAGMVAAGPTPTQEGSGSPGYWVFVGTYTEGGSKGIYRLSFDPETGRLGEPELAAEAANPSFLAVDPSRRYLFAVGEIGDYQGTRSGSVSAFALDAASGSLKALNSQPSLGGAPCHIVVDATGRYVLVANYSGGNVTVLPIGDDGRLGPASDMKQHEGSGSDPRRQEGPHAHSINLDAANRFAFAADLGLDQVVIYRFDSDKGTLTPNVPPFVGVAPGAGPRHFAFHPDGKHAYVINEMASTITAFDYDPETGRLRPLDTVSTKPAGSEVDNTTADIHVHPNGKFVYGSNRGLDSIAIFAVDPQTGRLRAIGHESTGGKTPRNFQIDPSGRFLIAANQNTGDLVVFRIDAETGELEPTGQKAAVPRPVCVQFVGKAK